VANPNTEKAIAVLAKLFAEQISQNQSILEQHGHDESGWETHSPDAVLFASCTEDVSKAMNICHQYKIPVVAFGAGSSVEGHVQALHGGLCIDLTQMNKVLAINAEDMDCRVEAGVTRLQLAHEIRDTGLFFSVDPGADATLGGMAATGASGTNTVKYGTIRENIRALTVVLADGTVVNTGTRARKSSAGYDLTHLFIGSEGTLGIITELTVKLHGVQEAVSAAVCQFDSVDAAVETVIQAIQYGIPIARMELMDALAMSAINKYSKLDYSESTHLFMEFHGSNASVLEQAEQVQEIAKDLGGKQFTWATKTEDRNQLWKARHDAYPAALQLRPGCKPVTTDVCVPISKMSECIHKTREMTEETNIPSIILGHVGDGNFHLLLLPDANNEQDIRIAKSINLRLVDLALSMEGTCTGEHGIGMGKIDALQKQYPEGVLVMKQIKQSLDPEGLLNPGKIFK